MKELIERLEKATGPDRELDCAIWFSLQSKSTQDRSVILSSGLVEERYVQHRRVQWEEHHSVPNYTASIDAALTLVSEGCKWNVDSRPYARVITANPFGVTYRSWEVVATPAIALCIAALKARSNG